MMMKIRRIINYSFLFALIWYGDLLVVDLEQPEFEYEIKVYGPETDAEYSYEDPVEEKEKQPEMLFCWICDPPQYIEFK